MIDQHGDALTKLGKEARAAVTGALSTKFPLDLLLGEDLSRLVSVCSSVVTRHGLLLERGITAALEQSGKFELLHNPTIPLTAAADSLVASNPPETLARVSLRYDGPSVRSTVPDIVVVDAAQGWAGCYSIKRGGGEMGARQRKPLERDLSATRLLLRSYLRDLGYSSVDVVTTAAIDWIGGARLPPHLTVFGNEVDEHFDVPVAATVERMTMDVQAELHRRVPELLNPLLERFGTTLPVANAAVDVAAYMDAVPTPLPAAAVPTRPVGPGRSRAS